MKPVIITQEEMVRGIAEKFKTSTLAEKRWIYCYLYDLDEWPVITDQLEESEYEEVKDGAF